MRTSRLCALALVLAGAAISRAAHANHVYSYISGISCTPANPHTDLVTYAEAGVTVTPTSSPHTIVLTCSLPVSQPSSGSPASDAMQSLYAAVYWSVPVAANATAFGFDPGCMVNIVNTSDSYVSVGGFPLFTPPTHPAFLYPYTTPVDRGVIGSLTLICYAVPQNAVLNSITLDACYASSSGGC